jgi:hypothetical protein
MKLALTRRTVLVTRLVALAADAIQIGLVPLFAAGALSPFNAGLDVLVAAFMVWRLGWHPAFLPAFVTELIPFVDVFPTWTLAVWFATRGVTRDD